MSMDMMPWDESESSVADAEPSESHLARSLGANPYRRRRPSRSELVAHGRFHEADRRGRYLAGQTRYLRLCADYLWVHQDFSIPLIAITGQGLSKKGGYIDYWDSTEGEERRFDFTRISFLAGHRSAPVARFLERVAECREQAIQAVAPEGETDPAYLIRLLEITRCELCESGDVHPYRFSVYKSFGIIFKARVWSVRHTRRVLCPKHARQVSLVSSLETGLYGHWSIPGCLCAPTYVYDNIMALRPTRAITLSFVLASILVGILLPYLILFVLIGAAVVWPL